MGSKKSPKAPDYTPVAQASAESARLATELGQAQLAEARRQYDNDTAIAKPVVDAQLGLMQSQQQQGDEYYNYMKDTFRPVEQGLVEDANAFDEAAAKEQFARTAAADLQDAQANQEAQNTRAMLAMGVNPNSGKFQSVAAQQNTLDAAARAGATNNARVQADNLGWAKKMDVTGLGRNLTGASQGAYGLSMNAGNSAVGNQMKPGGALMAGMSSANGTMMQGMGQQVQGLSSVLGAQTGVYNAGKNSGNPWANVVGTGLGMWAGGGFKGLG